MNCPKCGQEMIDIKDYCVNCGKKLKKEEKTDKVIIKKFEHLIKEYKKNKQKALDNLR